jgi:hypothetical protein
VLDTAELAVITLDDGITADDSIVELAITLELSMEMTVPELETDWVDDDVVGGGVDAESGKGGGIEEVTEDRVVPEKDDGINDLHHVSMCLHRLPAFVRLTMWRLQIRLGLDRVMR